MDTIERNSSDDNEESDSPLPAAHLSSSDNESDSNEDFSDFDMSLLEHADEIMQQISPQKSKQKHVKVPKLSKKKTDAASKEKEKSCTIKGKKLSQAKIEEIISHLKMNQNVLREKCIEDLKKKCFWDTHTGYRESLNNCLAKTEFRHILDIILDDYTTLYLKNNKGTANMTIFNLTGSRTVQSFCTNVANYYRS